MLDKLKAYFTDGLNLALTEYNGDVKAAFGDYYFNRYETDKHDRKGNDMVQELLGAIRSKLIPLVGGKYCNEPYPSYLFTLQLDPEKLVKGIGCLTLGRLNVLVTMDENADPDGRVDLLVPNFTLGSTIELNWEGEGDGTYTLVGYSFYQFRDRYPARHMINISLALDRLAPVTI